MAEPLTTEEVERIKAKYAKGDPKHSRIRDIHALLTTVEAAEAEVRALTARLDAAHTACERVRDAFSFMPHLNGAVRTNIRDVRAEVNDALGHCLPAVDAVLDKDRP